MGLFPQTQKKLLPQAMTEELLSSWFPHLTIKVRWKLLPTDKSHWWTTSAVQTWGAETLGSRGKHLCPRHLQSIVPAARTTWGRNLDSGLTWEVGHWELGPWVLSSHSLRDRRKPLCVLFYSKSQASYWLCRESSKNETQTSCQEDES
jgi:hypothetical protein